MKPSDPELKLQAAGRLASLDAMFAPEFSELLDSHDLHDPHDQRYAVDGRGVRKPKPKGTWYEVH
jgi:hypothetical protein